LKASFAWSTTLFRKLVATLLSLLYCIVLGQRILKIRPIVKHIASNYQRGITLADDGSQEELKEHLKSTKETWKMLRGEADNTKVAMAGGEKELLVVMLEHIERITTWGIQVPDVFI
jgi:hypothetical protein